jgi:hypothetical protein
MKIQPLSDNIGDGGKLYGLEVQTFLLHVLGVYDLGQFSLPSKLHFPHQKNKKSNT